MFLDVPQTRNLRNSGIFHGGIYVALNVHLWNIPPWNIPLMRKLRNHGIFYGGMFHRRALNATVEYSTVEYSMVAQIARLWNI